MNLKDERLNFFIWEQILTGRATFAKVGTLKGIVFEIRTKEQGHNQPHCHVRYAGAEVSISLVDCSVLAGNIPTKQQKVASQWVEQNIDVLKKYWNTYHKEIVA